MFRIKHTLSVINIKKHTFLGSFRHYKLRLFFMRSKHFAKTV